jgi:hypothetical protein
MMDWIYLAQDSDQWRDFRNTIMALRIPWTEGNSRVAEEVIVQWLET